MKRVENFNINKNVKYHGFEGPISISSPKPTSTLNDKLISGFENIGITRNKDYNGAKLAGVSMPQYALKHGNQSTAIEYILQAQGLSNFNLTLNAFVTKVLINQENKSAYGVTFVKNNVTYRATVRKEVILSAGSFNTPKLLMLSGVGPRTELENNGIKVIKSLPVGLNLKVQPCASFFLKSDYIEPSRNLRDLVKEYLDGEGLLTIENNQGAIAFFRGNGSMKGNPNLGIAISNPTAIPAPPFFANFRKDFGEAITSPYFANTFSTSIYLNEVFSNGNVTLKSNNVIDFPNINLNLFEDSRDIETMYEGVQVALRFAAVMNKFGVKLTPVFLPSDCNSYNNTTRQYWYCVIRQITTPYIYGTATVKMGPPSDPYSVVNDALQVYNIAGLRVVDSAVLPVNINSCGNSIGYVIGEKAADILKKTYGYHNRYK